MSKKLTAFMALLLVGLGGAASIAMQTHAQSITPVAAPTVITPSATNSTVSVQVDTDKETNDDGQATVSNQKDTQEQGENSAADKNEVEDAQ